MQNDYTGRLIYLTGLLLNVGVVLALLVCQLCGRSEARCASLVQPLLPYLLLANFAFLLFWLFQWRLWFILLPLVGFLIQIPYLRATLQFFPSGKEFSVKKAHVSDRSVVLRVCTYNVHCFSYGMNRSTVWQVAKMTHSEAIDVLCIQEFDVPEQFTLDSIEKVYQYLPYHAYCIQDSGLDLAIFSRYPILTHRAIEVGADGSHALWCDLDIRGKRIRIYNCHLQTTNFNQTRFNNSAGLWFWNYKAQVKKTDKLVKTIYQNTVKRNAQIREIDHHVRECAYPVIVCGDFNSTPASYAYDLVQRHLTDGFRQTGRGYAYTYNRLHKLFRIDYIFYSTQFSGQRYWSVNNGLSDHNPVMMSIRL